MPVIEQLSSSSSDTEFSSDGAEDNSDQVQPVDGQADLDTPEDDAQYKHSEKEKPEPQENEFNLELSKDDYDFLSQKAAQHKEKGNRHFGRGDWEDALKEYRSGIECCPDQEKELLAALLCNLAACQMKAKRYGEAVEACNEALHLKPDYIKALLRRAQANEKSEKWGPLEDCKKDYERLVTLLPPDDNTRKTIPALVRALEPRIKAAQEREKDEMLRQLKGLGNSFLGKLGMSTDNFNFSPSSNGGYSMNYQS